MTSIPTIASKLAAKDVVVLSRLADNWQAAFMLSDANVGWSVVPNLLRLRKAGLAQSRMGGAQVLNWAITDNGKAVRTHLEKEASK